MMPPSSFLFISLVLLVFSPTAFVTGQTVNCPPGDTGCERCQSTCSAIQPSHLPECCEAFNTCCDEYFSACKQCNSIRLTDNFFPEYCCASFTSCCDLVTTIKVNPTTKRPLSREPLLEDFNHQQLSIQQHSSLQQTNEVFPATNRGLDRPHTQRNPDLGSQRATPIASTPPAESTQQQSDGARRRGSSSSSTSQSQAASQGQSQNSGILGQSFQRRPSSRGRVN